MKRSLLPELPDFTSRIRALVPSGGSGPTPIEKRSMRSLVRRGGDLGAADRLALTEVRGSLTFTATTVTAWFTYAPRVWPFRADPARESLILAAATQYAGLAGPGINLHMRRTSVPFDIAGWADNLERNANPLPDLRVEREEIAGTGLHVPTWRQHITDAGMRLFEGQYASSRTHLGVTIPRPRGLDGKNGEAIEAGMYQRFAHIAEALGAGGVAARPATSAELLWLIYRSVGVGIIPPSHTAGDVGLDDITEFADAVSFERDRHAMTTQITDRRTGRTVHVAVLTVGRMEELTIPQVHQPWAHLSDQAGFPVEWSSRVEILGAGGARNSLEHRLRMIRSQQNDYADHDLDEPRELERLAYRAADIGDQMDTGRPVDAARAHGWHRLAVHGDTREECMANARDLARLYEQEAHITLTHPKAQWHLLREFIPGEAAVNTGYLRRMPVTMLAAAMPQATASVGDDRGDLIGYTAGSSEHPVFWDPHRAMEIRDSSGLAVFVAEPGGGKSTLMGAVGYLNARRGVQVTLMDPSGPLARLCLMPELAPYSRVIDLTGSEPGTLAPYALIPDPRRDTFPAGELGDQEYTDAVGQAESERLALVLDVSRMLLPPRMLAAKGTENALWEALRLVPPRADSTLEDVIEALRVVAVTKQIDDAEFVANRLEDNKRMAQARLFFGNPPPGTLSIDAPFTVITMGGLRLPDPSVAREDWSVEEALAVPMLYLANRFAVRRAYSGDPNARKLVGLDEAHIVSGWASGRSFLIRLARDSRKWNLAALVASQNPKDILGLDVQNLVSTVFVGRIADNKQVAADAIEMLGEQLVGAGYEVTLAGLSQHADTADRDSRLGYREFVMRDVDRRVQKIRADVSYVHGLLDALNTTPGKKV